MERFIISRDGREFMVDFKETGGVSLIPINIKHHSEYASEVMGRTYAAMANFHLVSQHPINVQVSLIQFFDNNNWAIQQVDDSKPFLENTAAEASA